MKPMPKSRWPIWICSRAESAARTDADRLRRRLAAALASCAIMPVAAPAGQDGIQRLPDAWQAHASVDSIYFARGAATIDETAAGIIQRHASKLRGAPGLSVTIVAHTDDLGSASLELARGQKRLDAVRGRLEESGISVDRIRSLNHGSEGNSTQECTDEDCRRFRRRVDFLFHR